MAELELICNRCLTFLEVKQQVVATSCKHLYCLDCARTIVDSGDGCPQCEHAITKSNIKLVNIMQDPGPLKLMLCGQGPEVALSSALASIQFWNTQQELKSQLMQQMLQKKIDKVQAACKRKLEEVHNGYVKAKRKYEVELQHSGTLGRDIQELQQKYNQKASQAKKLGDLLKQAQQDNSNLKGRMGLGGPGNARSMSPLGPATANRGGQLVTTVQKTSVFGTLTDMSPTGNTGMLARHQGHHSARPLQQLAAGGRPNTAAAAFMGGVLEPALSPPVIGAAARRRSGIYHPNGGSLQGLLGGHGGGGNSGGSNMMNNLSISGQQQSARAFFNGSPSGMVSL